MRIFLISTLLLCSPFFLLAQTKFHRDFTSQIYISPSKIISQPDNSVVFGFNFELSQSRTKYAQLVKVHALGDTLWSRTYEAFRMDNLIEAHNGFLLTGSGVIKTDVQGNTEWQAKYGRGWNGACKDSRSGYMLAGREAIVHIDSIGNIIWQKEVPYYINKLIRSHDGNYAAIGEIPGQDIYLLRFDELGNSLDVSALNTRNDGGGKGYDIIQSPDSNFYFCGTITHNYIHRAFLAKSNPAGRVLWVSHGGLDTGQDEHAYALTLKDDTHIYLTGFNGSFMGGITGRNPYILKVDSSGNPIDVKGLLFGGAGLGLATDAQGSIWVSGQHNAISKVSTFLIRLTDDFSSCTHLSGFSISQFTQDSLFQNNLSTSSFGPSPSLVKTNANYLATAPQATELVCTSCAAPATPSFGYTVNNRQVSFTDSSDANIEWFWDFGDGNSSNNQHPIYTYSSSGTYEVCLTVSNACGMSTFCDSVSVGTTPVDPTLPAVNLVVSPNPASHAIRLDFRGDTHETYQLSLMTLAGQEVLHTKEIGPETYSLDLSPLPAGMYLLHVRSSSGQSATKKILKL